jgi:hypothetical protein
MEQKTTSEMMVDYDVVSEFAGHQPNRRVPMAEAVEDIFTRVKEKGMQCAVKGEFIQFNTIAELQRKLEESVVNGFSIRCFDENIGG